MKSLNAEDWDSFERALAGAYLKFAPLAERYGHSFRRRTVTSSLPPTMLFLGNHSSGKSTLINWLAGGEPIQDTGLAPTDDGFTVIAYAEAEEDVAGPAALARLPAEFAALASLGGTFLQRLVVKFRRRELLKRVTFVDSPGMIDSADASLGRNYDFEGAVRILADVSDMVFFLLDPDKPGTTGETVHVFSRCLKGMEFKLRVLLNKCDLFSGVYDFARTYGTVCWNLARVLPTKDLPKILTVYSGETRTDPDSGFSLADFNRARDEFLSLVREGAARRRDNVYSQSLADFTGLSMRMAVVDDAWRRLFSFGFACRFTCAVVSAACGASLWLALLFRAGAGRHAAAAAGCALAAALYVVSRPAVRLLLRTRRRSLADRVDSLFESAYASRPSGAPRDDIRQTWASVREGTAEIIRSGAPGIPLFAEARRMSLERAVRSIFPRARDASGAVRG